jgi:hypothetical protein
MSCIPSFLKSLVDPNFLAPTIPTTHDSSWWLTGLERVVDSHLNHQHDVQALFFLAELKRKKPSGTFLVTYLLICGTFFFLPRVLLLLAPGFTPSTWRQAMRQPRALSAFCLGVLLFQTTGCQSFYPYEGELPTAWTEGMEREVVWVKHQSGDRWKMTQVTQDSVGVKGLLLILSPKGQPMSMSIPSEDISRIEVSRVSSGKTALLVGGIVGTLVALTIHSLNNMTIGFGNWESKLPE